MRKWLERSFRRELLLVLAGVGFILLVSAFLHVFEPRKIVRWDDVLATAAADTPGE